MSRAEAEGTSLFSWLLGPASFLTLAQAGPKPFAEVANVLVSQPPCDAWRHPRVARPVTLE